MGASGGAREPTALIRALAFAFALVVAGSFVPAVAAVHAAARSAAAGELKNLRALHDQKKWAALDSLARPLVARLDQPPLDSLALADALYFRGMAALSRATFTDTGAFEASERALAIRRAVLPPGDNRLFETSQLLCRWYQVTTRPAEAAAVMRELIRIRTPVAAARDSILPETWRGLGFALRDGGDCEAAIAAWDTANRRRRERQKNDYVIGLTLAEIGRCHYLLERLDRGRDSALAALSVIDHSAGRETMYATVPLDYLATIERGAGRLTTAVDYSQEALRIARLSRKDDDVEVARIRRNMAAWLTEMGDYAGSIALIDQVLPVYRRIYGPTNRRTIGVLSMLGNAMVSLGDSSGLAVLREAEAWYASRPGSPDPELSRALHPQAALLLAIGRPAEARAICERALAAADSAPATSGRTESMRILRGQIHATRVEAMIALRDTGLARAHAGLVRTIEQFGLDTTGAGPELRDTDARALHALGRSDAAWSTALAAEAKARERTLQVARSQSDERSLMNSSLISQHLDLLFDLAGPDPARLETAWDRCVRNRGLVRAEIARRRLPPGLDQDTLLAAAHRRWIEAQRSLARSLTVSTTESAALANLREKAAEAERRYARALTERQAVLPAADVGLSEVRARLAPNAALVSFVSTESEHSIPRLRALIVRGGRPGITAVDLGSPAAARAGVDAWKTALASWPGGSGSAAAAAEKASRALGEQVRKQIWDPIAPALKGVEDVHLVPDGPLLALAWPALPTSGGRYLVENEAHLHVLFAERDLLSAPAVARERSLLVMGSPAFGDTTAPATGEAQLAVATVRSAQGPCAGGTPAFAAIPATLAETREVAAAWRAAGGRVTELVEGAATEAAFKREAPGRAVLHVATHGVVVGDRCADGIAGTRGVGGLVAIEASTPKAPATKPPVATTAKQSPRLPSPWASRRTWLALAGARRPPAESADENDGRLSAEEVVTLDLTGTEWVVLSACHSGLGEAWSREGALGMRRAFALAGARAVIASDWAVEDQATREWMVQLHAARLRGAPTAEAVASASRAVLSARRAGKRTTHPFYWAAFGATGD